MAERERSCEDCLHWHVCRYRRMVEDCIMRGTSPAWADPSRTLGAIEAILPQHCMHEATEEDAEVEREGPDQAKE